MAPVRSWCAADSSAWSGNSDNSHKSHAELLHAPNIFSEKQQTLTYNIISLKRRSVLVFLYNHLFSFAGLDLMVALVRLTYNIRNIYSY